PRKARKWSLRHARALPQLADPNDIIEVPGVGDRPPRKLSLQTLAEVIEPRIEELYKLAAAERRQSGVQGLLSRPGVAPPFRFRGAPFVGYWAARRIGDSRRYDRVGRGRLPSAGSRGR